ncbi:lysophospholipase L1-like esterase [Saccharothrix tamanrassetensis]|uniref:Lysophospholipase L1-like esterase n=1 Tax=Saccharothrix tamanrassetensis TaxID=1051531 RepID=A0A841CR61_9PSEU|nr:GDSL-type esterase/lipase family protein [Saccharothrix tamanrassetensis]MBB5959779.1 lysophospholipase L1-like esterase [Saccharothrix tamanrassetensis]
MPGVRRFALVWPLLALIGACTAGPAETPATSTSASTNGSAPPAERVYVSLGDSYATGYRPADAGAPAGASRDGFAYVVAGQSDLRLINLACSGATSAQLRGEPGCAPGNRAPDAPDPAGRTQLDAAVQTLREHQGRVGLVTVVIGGNDLAPCARASDAVACASRAVADIRANLAAILPALREAAGDTRIVGLTYPDVFLGAWVSPAFPDGQNLARLSVTLFRDVLNAALKAEYEKIGADFVDVTAATGGYGPLTETTQDPTYGAIPTPVAKVCDLTYFCRHTDVHPTAEGHQAIASAVLEATRR